MARFAYELVFALAAVVLVTLVYVVVAWKGAPGPGTFLGHGLGILGFLLMLATETLYSIRKRVRRFNYGPTGQWLRFHVFTGIVGPYLVLLHTAGKLHGLAGVLTFVTVLVVLSGFVGRYVYTATPRTLGGVELDVVELQKMIEETDARLRAVGGRLGKAAQAILDAEPAEQGWVVVVARPYLRWRQHQRIHAALARLDGEDRAEVALLEDLLDQHYRLRLQIHSLAAARQLLAVWHLMHVPLGGVLFTLAFIHVFAALYYSTLQK
jgi:hypothetical protein